MTRILTAWIRVIREDLLDEGRFARTNRARIPQESLEMSQGLCFPEVPAVIQHGYWTWPICSWFIFCKWWSSRAMLVYKRVMCHGYMFLSFNFITWHTPRLLFERRCGRFFVSPPCFGWCSARDFSRTHVRTGFMFLFYCALSCFVSWKNLLSSTNLQIQAPRLKIGFWKILTWLVVFTSFHVPNDA